MSICRHPQREYIDLVLVPQFGRICFLCYHLVWTSFGDSGIFRRQEPTQESRVSTRDGYATYCVRARFQKDTHNIKSVLGTYRCKPDSIKALPFGKLQWHVVCRVRVQESTRTTSSSRAPKSSRAPATSRPRLPQADLDHTPSRSTSVPATTVGRKSSSPAQGQHPSDNPSSQPTLAPTQKKG